MVASNVIYVFIDASNLWQAQKAKGKFLDYEKTQKYIKEKYQGTDIKVLYYTAYPAEGTRSYSLDSKHKFFTFLKKGLGFNVVKKELKRITVVNESGEAIEEKRNMDVEITIDALHYLDQYHTAIFLTGDSDFLALVVYLKNHKKKVYIFSSRHNISQELRTGADGYTDISNINDIWGRDLKHKAELQKEEV